MKIATKTKKIEILKTNLPLWNRYRKIFPGMEPQLDNCQLQNLNLEKADLRCCNFEESCGEKINFKNANLRGAKFGWANLWKADFKNANLEYTDFQHAEIKESYNLKIFVCETTVFSVSQIRHLFSEIVNKK